MVTVEQAEEIVLAQIKDYGAETLYFEDALGRVLAEDLKADRDLPPYDRVTMDGIAIKFESFENGNRSFKMIGTQAAGDKPIEITNPVECVEIMTGAALPSTTDTVIRYEDLDIKDSIAIVTTETVTKNQSIHFKGSTLDLSNGYLHQNKLWESWVVQATMPALEHVFHYQNSKKEKFRQPVFEMLAHLFNHSTYHRGQLVTMLRQLEVSSIPATDFIIWSRTRK